MEKNGHCSTETKTSDTMLLSADLAIGVHAGTRGFELKLCTSPDCKVNLQSCSTKLYSWLVRFDKAHKWASKGNPSSVPHINLNTELLTATIKDGRIDKKKFNKKHKVRDPHLPIPGGMVGLEVAYLKTF